MTLRFQVVNLTDEAIYALAEQTTTLERLHLSYCEKVSVKAITYLLNRLTGINHLSLTGITAFRTPELRQFCRPMPKVDTSLHMRNIFPIRAENGVI